ncbi:group 1 truncated hemoglobin [Paenibacillus psychroresistens]|uniref:Group 1 truncated hemoglobin n=1 Tax=Paenibacillus psychroresistens TaxID=1778678 RepID=A0A6B8RV75_9BACL|nr:group 1 truncated hemoglobin [Paenibacillus psychroresistens]QGQ99679.1 group 1 truncated hemoglobin [Paenibacillus psychroresistens]
MEKLHNKFGGQIVIAKLVKYFYQQVLTDNTIKHFFTSPDKEQQRKHQVKFISLILSSSNTASAATMAKENPELNLQPVHYQTIAKHLSNALIYFGVHETHIGQIVGTIAPSSNQGSIKKWVNNSYAHLL